MCMSFIQLICINPDCITDRVLLWTTILIENLLLSLISVSRLEKACTANSRAFAGTSSGITFMTVGMEKICWILWWLSIRKGSDCFNKGEKNLKMKAFLSLS